MNCVDIDECLTNPCGTNEDCTNTIGSYTCSCSTGYTLIAGNCVDINECNTNNGGCSEGCVNTDGSYTCKYCLAGYTWDNTLADCADINECSLGTDSCQQVCHNTDGSYTCSCNTGYQKVTGQPNNCEDIDECSSNTDGCDQGCTNSVGGFTCYCASGYTLEAVKTCQDINECTLGTDDCGQHCVNTDGSYSCRCDADYYKDSNITCALVTFQVLLAGTATSSSSITLSWQTTFSPSTSTVSLLYYAYSRDVTFVSSSYLTNHGYTGNLQATISTFLPYRDYQFYIYASANLTAQYSNYITVKTHEDTPSQPPTNVSALTLSATEISLSWFAPSRESQNGVLEYYVILINVTSSSHPGWTITQINVTASSTFHTITGLKPYTTYTLSVSAATSVGRGPYSLSTTVTTHESTPTQPPRLSVTSKTHSTISLTLRPPTDTYTLNGVITYYLVTYTGVNVDTSTRTARVMASSTDNLSAVSDTLIGLQEGVSYSIKASVSTSVGTGPNSDSISVTTDEIAPTGTPQNIVFTSILNSSLSFKWGAVVLSEQNGVITGYRVSYKGVDIDTEKRTFNVTSKSANISLLEEGEKYLVKVSAINSAGIGPSISSTQATAEIAPSGTPLDVVARSTSATSITLKWSTPTAEYQNGEITGFQIVVTGREHDTNNYTYNVSATLRTYTIGSLEEAHSYEIIIRAYNKIGYGPFTSTITLSTIESAPGAAPRSLVGTKGRTWINLTWSAPAIADQNGEITVYEIIYEDLQSTDVLVNTTGLSINITNLEEYEFYVFRVRAYTAVGSGPYSSPLALRTLEDVPSAPPSNVKGYVISATEIGYKWQSPALIDQNGVLTGFYLKITSADNTYTFSVLLASSRNSYNFTNLHPYTNYSIRVRAETTPGAGPYSTTVTGETFQAAPSGTPENVVFNITSTSITIKWDFVSQTQQNGIITGYIIKYRGLSLDTETRNLTIVSRSVTLTNLQEGNKYEISISATTKVGAGPYLTLDRTTDEIPPTATPSDLSINPSGSTSLLIKWKEPNKAQQNGVILSYLIIVVGLQHDSSVYRFVTISSVRTYTVTDLEENHQYYVSMSANNSAGYGPSTGNISVFTNEAAPSSAPQSVYAIGNISSLFIVWSAPPTPDQNGVITKYEVYYTDVDSGVNRSIFETKLRVVISNLNENELFRIQIRAYTSYGPGPYSTVIYVQTLEGPPTAAPTNVAVSFSDTQVALKWQDPPSADQNGVLTKFDIRISSVNNTYEQVFSTQGATYTYTITGLHPYTNYSIQVRANTQPGYGPYSTPLSVTTKQSAPSGPPRSLQAVYSTTYISLSWEAPDKSLQNGEIAYYVITYSGVVVDTTNSRTTTTSTNATLQNLEEGSAYSISVCAYTIAIGPCVKILVTTSETFPTGAPTNFQVIAITSTQIITSWQSPTPEEQNGVITGFQVIAAGQEHDTNIYRYNVSEDTFSYEFEDLEESHEYSLQVRVINAVGFGPYTDVITAVTSEDISGGAPLNLTYTATDTTIKLSWSEPLIHLQNGELLIYEIEYYSLSNYLTNTHQFANVSATQTYVVIRNLYEDVLYQLKVRGYTSIGPGPYSTEISVRTNQTTPSSTPTNFQLTTISATQIQGTWGPLPVLEQNGKITGYELSVYSSNNSTIITYSTTQSSYTIQSLHPYTLYTVQIRAVNSIGPGPSTAYMNATTLQALPSSPPINFKLTVLSAYQIKGKWQPPPTQEQNGPITGYDVKLVTANNSFHQIYSTVQTEYTLASLHPDTSYSVQVRARNSIGPSEYTSLTTVSTLEALPSSAPTDLQVSVLSATQIQLTYEYPLGINQNGEITGFDISLTSATDSIQHIISTILTSYTLSSLHPYTTYCIQVRANNSIGAGPYTAVNIVTTNQALPADAPTQLTILQMTHNSVNFSWYQIASSSLNGEFLSYTILVTNTLTTDTFSQSSLYSQTSITELTPYTQYSLSVAVVNTQGTGPYSSPLNFSTNQYSPSQGPQILPIQHITNNSASVQFTHIPVSIQNGPIISYTLNLHTTADSLLVTSLNNSPINTPSFLLTDLLPYREYTVLMTGTNSAGTSPSTSINFVTLEYFPSGPPTSILATPYSTYVVLLFQPPEASQQNGIISEFWIRFGDSTYTTNTTQYTVWNLEELTQFQFSIAASTSVGIGPYSEVFSVTTLSAPPTAAPQNVTGTALSYHSILVSWEPIPANHQNGDIINYIVYYQGEQFDTSERKKVVAVSTTTTALEHLKPYELYTITVVAENNQGSGPQSAEISVRTYEGIPSVAPTGLSVVTFSATSINIKWVAIPSFETNGILTQYELIYQANSTFDTKQYKYSVPGDVTKAILSQLHPAVEYQLFIRGYTSVGNGPNSQRTRVLLPESNPTGAPVLKAITVVSATQIYVAWMGIIDSQSNGVIIAYEVNYFSKYDQSQNFYQNTTGNTLYTTLIGLEVGSEYDIGVRGYTAVGPGPYSGFLTGTTAPPLVKCYDYYNTHFYNPCYNNGTCLPDNSRPYLCQCAPGYTGPHCYTDIDDCEDNRCEKGYCIDHVNGYSCHCDMGYTGKYCETNIDDCENNECLNGTCEDGLLEYTCICADNYNGTYCQHFNSCVLTPCTHGSCNWESNSYTCTCETGYEGENCDVNINDCVKNLCEHGNCVDLLDSYECDCSKGYKGEYCDVPSDGETCKREEVAGFIWEETGYRITRTVPCGSAIRGLTGLATRYCKSGGEWADLDISNCARQTFRDLDFSFNDYIEITGELTPLIAVDLLERLSVAICSNQTTNIESTEPTFYPYEISIMTQILTYLMKTIDSQNSSTQAQMISQMTPGLMCIISNIINIRNLQIFSFSNSSLNAIDINDVIEKMAMLNAKYFDTDSAPKLFSESSLHMYIAALTERQSIALPDYELSDVQDTGLYPDSVTIPASEVTTLFSESNGEVPVVAVAFSRYLGQAMGPHSQTTTLGFSPIGTRVITMQTSLGQPLIFKSPITLEYWVFAPYNTSQKAECVAWDGKMWSDEGLYISDRNEHTIACHSIHTTSFAILFSLEPETLVPESDPLVLRIITYVVGGISLICLVIALIFLILLCKDLLKNDLLLIQFNLAIAMTLALIFCIIGVYPITSIPITCQVVTILFQYFTLATASFLLCYAIQSLHMLFTRNRLIRTFFIFVPIGWVLPLIITAATGAINWNNYGVLDTYCWMSEDFLTFWMLAGPILVLGVVDVLLSFFLVCRISTSKPKAEWHDQARRAVFGCVLLAILFCIPWILSVVNLYIEYYFFKWAFVIFYSVQGIFFLLFIVLPIKLIKSKIFRVKGKVQNDLDQRTQQNVQRRSSQRRLLSVSEEFTYQLSPSVAATDFFNPLYNTINVDPDDIGSLEMKANFECGKLQTKFTNDNDYVPNVRFEPDSKRYDGIEMIKVPLESPYASLEKHRINPPNDENPYMEIPDSNKENPFIGLDDSKLQADDDSQITKENPFSEKEPEKNIYSVPRNEIVNVNNNDKETHVYANDSVTVESTEETDTSVVTENEPLISTPDEVSSDSPTTIKNEFVNEGFAMENATYSALPTQQINDEGFVNPCYMEVPTASPPPEDGSDSDLDG